ncbi:MAG: hypothetical protein FWC79_07085 [Oscillospiraceae bacterium]|nr:hypothetical protein [Oscillospiraceae bacterium]
MKIKNKKMRLVTLILQIIAIVTFFIPPLFVGGTVRTILVNHGSFTYWIILRNAF